jgi:hypothetical protein
MGMNLEDDPELGLTGDRRPAMASWIRKSIKVT